MKNTVQTLIMMLSLLTSISASARWESTSNSQQTSLERFCLTEKAKGQRQLERIREAGFSPKVEELVLQAHWDAIHDLQVICGE